MALTETTTDRDALRSPGDMESYLVRGGADVGNVSKGCLAVLDATGGSEGYLKTYAPDGVAASIFAGVTAEGYDNVDGTNGVGEDGTSAARVKVWRRGVFEFNHTVDGATYGAATMADLGKEVYTKNNDTVTIDGTKTTNTIKVGKLVGLVGDGKRVRVRIDNYAL